MTPPATSPDLPDDDYVLGRTSEEYQHLHDPVAMLRKLYAWTPAGWDHAGPGIRWAHDGHLAAAGDVGRSGCALA